MMSKSADSLAAAFLEDHRNLTRGLTLLLEALEQENLEEAVRLSQDLDQKVGPHMQFEEEVFYPLLTARLGRSFAARLYHEHAVGREAVRKIKALQPGQFDKQSRLELIADVRKTLDHALSCGSLLSYAKQLDREEQQKLLADLIELRSTGRRWTDLESSDSKSDRD